MEQRDGLLTLQGEQIFEAKSFSLPWHIVPVLAFGVRQRVHHALFRRGVERTQEGERSLREFFGSRMRPEHGTRDHHQAQMEDKP